MAVVKHQHIENAIKIDILQINNIYKQNKRQVLMSYIPFLFYLAVT